MGNEIYRSPPGFFIIALFLALTVMVILNEGCKSTNSPHVEATYQGEVIEDPELYAKWIFAHTIQGEFLFLVDVPSRSGQGWMLEEGEEYLEERKYDNIWVPVEEVIPHISIAHSSILEDGSYWYRLSLDSTMQQRILAAKGDRASDEFRRWVTHEGIVNLEIRNGELYVIEAL